MAWWITDKPECKKCAKALQELENIDDEADQLGIGFVKIHDEELAEEYSLGDLPRLVYYRHEIPIIYEGESYSFLRLTIILRNWMVVVFNRFAFIGSTLLLHSCRSNLETADDSDNK